MLGESHSLLHEFPKSKASILSLVNSDENFAKDAQHYEDLDNKIRDLELSNSPIDDQAMHQLKHDRSLLKDSLYQRILQAETEQ
ncbi:YdcH family protein [Agarivorans albus]